MTVQIPLSQSGDPASFAAAIAAHVAALMAHRTGKTGTPAPHASDLIESLVVCVRRGDPLPDMFSAVPYEIVDDTPPVPEVSATLQVLRETLSGPKGN